MWLDTEGRRQEMDRFGGRRGEGRGEHKGASGSGSESGPGRPLREGPGTARPLSASPPPPSRIIGLLSKESKLARRLRLSRNTAAEEGRGEAGSDLAGVVRCPEAGLQSLTRRSLWPPGRSPGAGGRRTSSACRGPRASGYSDARRCSGIKSSPHGIETGTVLSKMLNDCSSSTGWHPQCSGRFHPLPEIPTTTPSRALSQPAVVSRARADSRLGPIRP